MPRDEHARWKKIEFRVHLLKIYLKHDDMERFAKEFYSLTIDVFSRIPQGAPSEEWPRAVHNYIASTLHEQFLDTFFSIPTVSL